MKENHQNKSLVKVENNIFYKIRNLFSRWFGFKLVQCEYDDKTVNGENVQSKKQKDFFDSVKSTQNDNLEVLNLQKRYENGNLRVSQMSEEQYREIKDLYTKQIKNLTQQIKYKRSNLANDQ